MKGRRLTRSNAVCPLSSEGIRQLPELPVAPAFSWRCIPAVGDDRPQISAIAGSSLFRSCESDIARSDPAERVLRITDVSSLLDLAHGGFGPSCDFYRWESSRDKVSVLASAFVETSRVTCRDRVSSSIKGELEYATGACRYARRLAPGTFPETKACVESV